MIDEPLGFLLYSRFAVTVALVHIFLPYVVLVLYAGLRAGVRQPARGRAGPRRERGRGAGAGSCCRSWLRRRSRRSCSSSSSRPPTTSRRSPARRHERRDARGADPGQLHRHRRLGGRGRDGVPHADRLRRRLPAHQRSACASCGSTGSGSRADLDARQRSPITTTITILALLFLYVPLFVVVLFSFHSTAALSFPFEGFSLRWYRDVLGSEQFREAAGNSLVVATATSAVTLVFGTLAAYGLSRTRSRLRAPLTLLFFLPITLPGLFLGLSLLVVLPAHRPRPLAAQLSPSRTSSTCSRTSCSSRRPPSTGSTRRWRRRPPTWARTRGSCLRRVTLPQIWPVLIGATCLAFALSLRRVRHHLLRDRAGLDAADVHLVGPAPHDRSVDQHDLDPAARGHACSCSPSRSRSRSAPSACARARCCSAGRGCERAARASSPG